MAKTHELRVGLTAEDFSGACGSHGTVLGLVLAAQRDRSRN